MPIKKIIPWCLIWLRVLGCPLIVMGARLGWTGGWLSSIVILALLSDIYDGVLARRWGCETSGMRLADSLADTIFYLGVVLALWLRDPQILLANWQLLVELFGLEGLRYGFDLWKFHKAASYHSYLAKVWGLIIAIAVVTTFSFDRLGLMIRVAVIFGIIVNLEGLTMSLILPRWKNDVKTLGRAWAFRRVMLAETKQSV